MLSVDKIAAQSALQGRLSWAPWAATRAAPPATILILGGEQNLVVSCSPRNIAERHASKQVWRAQQFIAAAGPGACPGQAASRGGATIPEEA